MKNDMLADADVVPHLFHWNGRLAPAALSLEIRRRGWTIPADLQHFWILTGGGEAFESELLHGPLPAGTDQESDVLEATNRRMRSGLRRDLIVFHEGFVVTAVDQQTGGYVSFDLDLREIDRYHSFNDWYAGTIRAEYGGRYGLPPLNTPKG